MLTPIFKLLGYILVVFLIIFILIIKAPNFTKKYEGYVKMQGKTDMIGKWYHGIGASISKSAKIEDIGGTVQDSVNKKAIQ